MFLQDADIKAALAGLLKQSPGDMEPYWDQIVTDSHLAAYNEIITRLAARAFTPGQINAWDRGAEFEKSIALWWCLDKGVGLHEFNDKFVAKLDRRDELDKVQLTISQVLQTPGGTTGLTEHIPTVQSTAGQIGFGFQNTTDDEFTMQGFSPPLHPGPNRQSW